MNTAGPAPAGELQKLGSVLMRTRLFALSYAPLLAIFALRSESWLWRAAYVLVTVVVVVDGYRITHGQTKKTSWERTLVSVKDKGGDVSGYLATYVLPFLSGPPLSLWELAAYAVYFAVAWIVFVNSELLLINPTLYVLGWRVAQGVDSGGGEILVLARHTPREGEAFRAARFGSALVRVDDTKRPPPI